MSMYFVRICKTRFFARAIKLGLSLFKSIEEFGLEVVTGLCSRIHSGYKFKLGDNIALTYLLSLLI